MKYKLMGNNDYFNPIHTILNNRGIEDIDKFMNVNESVIHSWKLLKNIDKAVDCLLKHVENNDKIFVQADSDMDGFSSSAMLYNYIKRAFPKINIAWRVHEGKVHGLVPESVPNDVELVFSPDAGSNQWNEHKVLFDRGMDVIVLDHHSADKESEHAIVVNNQLSPEYPNKFLSGAGIVYKYCQAIDDRLGLNYADDYMDLMAAGLIGDSMRMTEPETRYYAKKGIENVKNNLLKALIEKQSYSMKNEVTINGIAFYIAPLVNATVRVGNLSELCDMFRAFTESKELVFNTRKKESETIQVSVARQLGNIRNRQNKLRDKGLILIEEIIENQKLNDNKVMIIDVTDILDKSLSGLVANQISNKYKKPCLLLRNTKDNKLAGSGRGYEKSELKDFRSFLLQTGKFDFVEGHANAFGCSLDKNKLHETNKLINEMLKDMTFDNTYDVDFLLPASKVSDYLVESIHNLRSEWSFGVSEPLICINDVVVNRSDVQILGKEKTMLKFKCNDIEFIKFKSNEDEYNRIVKNEWINFTVVGRVSLNEWNGRTTKQIIIEDYEYENADEYHFFY